MMPGAYRDALAIDERRQVMGVNVGNREEDRAAVDLRVSRAVDDDTRNLLEFLERVVHQGPLVGSNLVHAEILEVVDRRTQADAFGHTGGAGLELPREVVPARLVE